jgi:hypothetical protein
MIIFKPVGRRGIGWSGCPLSRPTMAARQKARALKIIWRARCITGQLVVARGEAETRWLVKAASAFARTLASWA